MTDTGLTIDTVRAEATADPRVAVLSARAARREVFRCAAYEFEDVVADVGDTHLAAPPPGRLGTGARLRGARQITRRSQGRITPRVHDTVDAPSEPADVVVVYCQNPADTEITAHLDLRRWGRRAVCFVEEVYVTEIDRWRGHNKLLDRFDHVWVANEDTVRAWQPHLRTPLAYLPFSVDALRFAPPVPAHPRTVDVMNIGRRSPVTHEALFEWARTTGHMYYFDSYRVGAVHDHRQHRWLTAAMLQRSRIAVSNRGVGSAPERTRWQASVPPRFFEAAAAGAVLVGVAPDLPGMAACFGWEGAHMPMAFDEPAAGDVVARLLADPMELGTISRRNVIESLRRHDHLYRLATMLSAVDVPLGPGTRSRLEQLERLAARHATSDVASHAGAVAQ